MKDYSNPGRKPMMYGGTAEPKKRMTGSPERGERVNPKGPTTVGSIQGASPMEMKKQKREEMKRNNTKAELQKIANGSGEDAMMARSILREMGDSGAMPPGDQEPAGKMYGGKAKK